MESREMEPIPDQPDDRIDLDLATPGSRLGARAIDTLIGVLVYVVLFVIVLASSDIDLAVDDPNEIDLPTGGQLILQWLPVVIWGLYEVPLTYLRGQTVGKMVTKIKVIAVDGDTPPLRNSAFLRWGVLAVPSILIPNYGLFITLLVGLWFLLDSRRQGLQDKAAGTYVVKAVPAPIS
jgi:uncharacterized RDD family membrane protein YckC